MNANGRVLVLFGGLELFTRQPVIKLPKSEKLSKFIISPNKINTLLCTGVKFFVVLMSLFGAFGKDTLFAKFKIEGRQMRLGNVCGCAVEFTLNFR